MTHTNLKLAFHDGKQKKRIQSVFVFVFILIKHIN